MKTAELTGAMLDYWVARAEGNFVGTLAVKFGGVPRDMEISPELFACARGDHSHYSTNWAHGGPIIDRELIELRRREVMPSLIEWVGISMLGFEQLGHTHLIAAMRAYVASKFGEEVPDADMAAGSGPEE